METNLPPQYKGEVYDDEEIVDLDDVEDDNDETEAKERNISWLTTTPSTKLGSYDFFEKVLRKPKHVLAPMVDQSELAFRLLCRRYNTDLCYTPMVHSRLLIEQPKYRKKHLVTCPEDRPLVTQLCGNEPAIVLQAALIAQERTDAIDLNFGCPQRIARRGYYGAFLMDNPELVYNIVRTLHDNLSVPVFCKMRVFTDEEKTMNFAKMLQKAGCQLLAVHGRTREMKGVNVGVADWKIIKKIKETLTIPVISNGNIRDYEDVKECLKTTGADSVMSAEGLLRNPCLFAAAKKNPFVICQEYLDICKDYPPPLQWVKDHLCKFLEHLITNYDGFKDRMWERNSVDELIVTVKEIEEELNSGTSEISRRPQKPQKVALTEDEYDNILGDTMSIFT